MNFPFGLQDAECILRSLRQDTMLNAFVVIAACISLCSSFILLRARALLIASVYRRVVILYKVFLSKIKNTCTLPFSAKCANLCSESFLIILLSLPHPTDTGPSKLLAISLDPNFAS